MSTENEVKAVLSISNILEDLKNGLKRTDIAEKYGITKSELSRHFQHPKLKGKKTITKPVNEFVLIDDTEDSVETENTAENDELVTEKPDPIDGSDNTIWNSPETAEYDVEEQEENTQSNAFTN